MSSKNNEKIEEESDDEMDEDDLLMEQAFKNPAYKTKCGHQSKMGKELSK